MSRPDAAVAPSGPESDAEAADAASGVSGGVWPRSSGLIAARAAVRRLPGGWLIWRIGVTVVGLVVIAVGIVLIPLPGPGWLIVFLGLSIWSTEYEWARQLTRYTRRLVGHWWAWMSRQRRWVQVITGAVGLAFTVAVSIGSVYLI